MEAKLQVANASVRNAEAEKQKLQEANWYVFIERLKENFRFANEKVAKLEKENAYLKGTNEELSLFKNNFSEIEIF